MKEKLNQTSSASGRFHGKKQDKNWTLWKRVYPKIQTKKTKLPEESKLQELREKEREREREGYRN